MIRALTKISSQLNALVPSLPTNFSAKSEDWQNWFDILTERGLVSASGELVHVDSAMSVPAFWQAVSLISGDVAKLPLYKYKRLPDGDREIVRDRFNSLINKSSSKGVSAFETRRRAMLHALIWQRAYLWVQRSPAGRPIAIFNLLPDRTNPHFDENGDLFYTTEVTIDRERKEIPLMSSEVIDIVGISIVPHKSMDLLRKIQDEIGLALARRGFASAFYARGAASGGILEIPPTFTETAARNLEEGFRNRVGRDEWFKTAILRNGAKFHQTTKSFQESQVAEMTADETRSVAQFFNIPPVKLGLPSDSYKSVEMLQRFYLESCLSHWLHAEAGAFEVKCLSERQLEKDTHFMEHNVSKLLEADSLVMNQVLEIQRRNEIISANEWRRKINFNRRDDPGGDEFQNPNTKPAPPSGGSGGAAAQPQEPTEAVQNLFRCAVSRITGRVSKDIQRCGNYTKWVSEREPDTRAVFRRDFGPLAEVVSSGDGPCLCNQWERDFFGCVRDALIEASNVAKACRRLENELPNRILCKRSE